MHICRYRFDLVACHFTASDYAVLVYTKIKNIFLTLKRSMQKIKQFHMVNGLPFVEIMDGLIGDQLHYRRLAVKLDVLLLSVQVFKTNHFTLTEQLAQKDSSLEMLQE